MIKREWPQHWPDMLNELDALSQQGVCHYNYCQIATFFALIYIGDTESSYVYIIYIHNPL